MKRYEIIEKCLRGEMRWLDAAQVLGISDRQLRRLRLSYQVNSIDGLRDMRLGKRHVAGWNDNYLLKVLGIIDSFSLRRSRIVATSLGKN